MNSLAATLLIFLLLWSLLLTWALIWAFVLIFELACAQSPEIRAAMSSVRSRWRALWGRS